MGTVVAIFFSPPSSCAFLFLYIFFFKGMTYSSLSSRFFGGNFHSFFTLKAHSFRFFGERKFSYFETRRFKLEIIETLYCH